MGQPGWNNDTPNRATLFWRKGYMPIQSNRCFLSGFIFDTVTCFSFINHGDHLVVKPTIWLKNKSKTNHEFLQLGILVFEENNN